ncbi:hypothetical protein BH11PSE14_BH11PSE14_04760 [soil metagenome]
MSWSAEQHRLLAGMGLQPMRERGTEPEPARRAQETRPPVVKPAALLDALHRAAGGGDISGLVADLERLRGEPALKRALWPRLRALRRH